MSTNQNMTELIFSLQSLTSKQLRTQYQQVFGETTNVNNKVWLTKRIAWGIQVNREGDISQRARDRALEIAQTSDIRSTLPGPGNNPGNNPDQRIRTATHTSLNNDNAGTSHSSNRFTSDPRLPMVGSVLSRTYKGNTYHVMVQESGFIFQRQTHKSLSAIAKIITGTHCNGFAFFKLNSGSSS